MVTLRTINGLLHRRAAELDSFLPALLIGVTNDYSRPLDDLGALQYTYSGRHYYMDSTRLTALAGTPARYCWMYDVRRSDDSTPVAAFRPANPAADPLLAQLVQDIRALLPWDFKSALWPTDHYRPGDAIAGPTGPGRFLTYARLFQGIEADEWGFADLLPGIAFWVDGSYEQHPELTAFMADRENYRVGGYHFTLLAASPDSSVLAYLVQSRVGEALDRVAGTVATMLDTRYRTVFWPATHMSEPGQLLVEHLAGQIVPYREAYAATDSGRVRFEDYLPAIAFWETHNLGGHPSFMRTMDSAASHETDDFPLHPARGRPGQHRLGLAHRARPLANPDALRRQRLPAAVRGCGLTCSPRCQVLATLLGLARLAFYAIVRSGLPGVVGYDRGTVSQRPGAMRLSFPSAPPGALCGRLHRRAHRAVARCEEMPRVSFHPRSLGRHLRARLAGLLTSCPGVTQTCTVPRGPTTTSR